MSGATITGDLLIAFMFLIPIGGILATGGMLVKQYVDEKGRAAELPAAPGDEE